MFVSKNINIEDVQFGFDGVKNFYYPFSRFDLIKIRSELVDRLSEKFSSSAAEESDSMGAFRLFSQYFISEVLSWYEATSLVSRIRKDNYTLNTSNRHIFVDALISNKAPAVVLFQNEARFPEASPFPQWMKVIVRELQWNGLDILSSKRWRDDYAVCLNPNKLTIAHAKKERVYLRYTHLSGFFPIETLFNSDLASKMPSENILEILNIVHDLFKENGIVFPLVAKEYLANWMAQATLFRNHFRQLLKSYNSTLPKLLWTGTGTGLIRGVLFELIRDVGGMVVTHDHGYGDVQHNQLAHNFVEYQATDKFFTYNQYMASIKSRELKSKYLFGKPIPEIRAVNKTSLNGTGSMIYKNFKQKIKKIMYVFTVYHAESLRFWSTPSEYIYFDFQVRMLSFLKSLGLEIVIKSHPEQLPQVAKKLSKFFDCDLCSEPIEETKVDVDAYLIDYFSSTSNKFVFSSEKPIVAIDLSYPDLLPEGEALIKKRCYYFKAFDDIENRIQVCWNSLSNVFDVEDHSFSMELCKKYYQYE